MSMIRDIASSTIAAIATPPGSGGIGIVRISGSESLSILKKIFHPRKKSCDFQSHGLYYGWIVDPVSGAHLDEVLAVYMKRPRTYTREDVVEIHCHGSFLVLRNILGQVLASGARLAEPGEFTKRAFLNGRIDLTRAEAVLDVLRARTQAGLAMAMAQLEGGLVQQLGKIRDSLVDVLAVLEVAIDFPDEDAEILDGDAMSARIRSDVLSPLQHLFSIAGSAKIYRDGVTAVLLGRPNVGKSSILNALLREDRAIVTPVPGTTRDTIEECFSVKGIPVRIVDMAGIRETAEEVEAAGIIKARRKADIADLIILILDSSRHPSKEDKSLYDMARDRKAVLVLNKMDIAVADAIALYGSHFPGIPMVPVSALHRTGIGDLEQALFAAAASGNEIPEESTPTFLPSLRHQDAFSKAIAACETAIRGIEDGLSPDLLAIDVQAILHHLGDISGETTAEDVLDRIFNQFCIGK